MWDWDIRNGNAILLEADARGIRVIDHMDHLVDVRQVERTPHPRNIYGHVAVAPTNERMTLPGRDYHFWSFDHFTRAQMT